MTQVTNSSFVSCVSFQIKLQMEFGHRAYNHSVLMNWVATCENTITTHFITIANQNMWCKIVVVTYFVHPWWWDSMSIRHHIFSIDIGCRRKDCDSVVIILISLCYHLSGLGSYHRKLCSFYHTIYHIIFMLV